MFAPVKLDEKGKAYHGGDQSLAVEFYNARELQTFETEQKGEPVYKDIPHIRIATPGSKTIVDRPVRIDGDYSTPSDPDRWPQQWARFQSGEKQRAEGHALIEMGLGERETKRLEFYNVLTVEHLANMPDGLLSELGLGARGIRDGAIKWLENKKSAENRLNEQEARIVEQDARIAELATQLELLLAAQKPQEPHLSKKNHQPLTKE